MWSAEIASVTEDPTVPGMSVTEFKFTADDGRVIEKDFERGLTHEQAVDYAKQKKDKLDADDKQLNGMKDFIANPPVGVINFTPPALTDQQQAEMDLANKRTSLIQLKQDLDLGLADQATYDVALADVKAAQSALTSAKVSPSPAQQVSP